ncbi:transcription regulator HTH, apses-type DNA-binding domain-containing protein, partial [Chytridium lagenaria]
YSTVCVLELTFPNGLSIMRRKMDGWINATHLLKVAGFMDKAKRTKVLEREVHCCVHEKIQGGMGGIRGHGEVPIDAAKELATKFSIHDKIQKIL